MSEMVDVVQVGYGPVGQVLASLLGRAGHTVTVLERHATLYGVSRAGTIDHEAMRILQSLGVAGPLEPKLAPTLGMNLLGADGGLLAKLSVERDSVSGWHSAYQLYQPDMEQFLDQTARATPGVEILQGWDVTTIEQHSDHVEVHSIHRTTGERRIDLGRYVVGADGANSIVRQLSGIELEDFGYVGSWLVCDFELLEANAPLPFAADFRCDPARPTLAGRWLGRRHSRMEFMVLPDEDPARFDSEDVCWDLAAPYGLVPTSSRLVRHAVYQFRSLLAERWRSGRAILVGDSAHVMPPFMGQGMCSGFRDAINLAWKLDLVLHGTASEDLLDVYTRERRPHIEQVIRASMGVGWLVSVTDEAEAAERDSELREFGLPPVPDFPILIDGAFHRDTTGSILPGGGTLGRQAVVERSGERGRLGEVAGHGWQILTRLPVDVSALSDRNRELLATVGAQIIELSPAPGAAEYLDVEMDYEQWFNGLGANVVVVRPDFYVYAALESVDELGTALDSLRSQLGLF